MFFTLSVIMTIIATVGWLTSKQMLPLWQKFQPEITLAELRQGPEAWLVIAVILCLIEYLLTH